MTRRAENEGREVISLEHEDLSMDIYVSNLTPDVTCEDLKKTFAAHGEVTSATILTEKMSGGRRTGPSRGMGFVAMPDIAAARAAIAALNQHEFRGRSMMVQEARPGRLSRHRR
jgi:RNA recognition motif-containing protein